MNHLIITTSGTYGCLPDAKLPKKNIKKSARKNNDVIWTIRYQQNMLQWNLIKNTNIFLLRSTRNMVSFVCKNAIPFAQGPIC